MKVDRAYWKKLYGTEWKAGTSRVKHVMKVLKERFPELTIEPTDYAMSDEYIAPDKTHKKHDVNIIVSDDSAIICDIEVTGSDIIMMPPNDIWILKGKFEAAHKRIMEKNIDTWFYTVYEGSEYVLDIDLIAKFNGNKAHVKYPKGVPESYIQIPCSQAYPKEKLFKWIAQQIK